MRLPRPGYADRLRRGHHEAPGHGLRHNDPAAPWLLPAKPRALRAPDWAEEAWRMWHQKEPRELLRQPYELPDDLVAVGRADRIYYSSDKWEEDGDFYTYYHDFDSHPTVYVPETWAWTKHADEDADVVDVVETLEMQHADDEVMLPMLSKTLELVVEIEGDKQSRKFKGASPLCCTRDLRTLVIFSSSGPVIVRGGKMVVTERGIVR